MKPNILQPLSDEHIQREASRQIGRDTKVEKVHVSLVRAGETVFHDEKVRTVSGPNLSYDSFMGHKLFGDNYVCGLKPVHRLVMGQAN